jgi:hypothetical protein
LQRPATDDDLVAEAEADEVMNRVLLERRVEGLRGTVDDQTLDDFLSQPVVDDELLNELDAFTPEEVLDARDLDRTTLLEMKAQEDPLGVLGIILADIESGNAGRNNRARRNTEMAMDLLRETLSSGNMRPAAENFLKDMNPELADQLLADLDIEELGAARESSAFGQEAQSLEDFERGTAALDEEGRADATARTVNAVPAFRNVIRSRSGGFFTRSAESIERLKKENPNSDYGTMPARKVIEAEMLDKFGPPDNGQLTDAAQQWQNKLVFDQVKRRKIDPDTVDLNDPLSVFDGEVAIQEVKAPNQFTGQDELAFTAKDFSAALSEELLQKRAKQADENKRIKNPRERTAAQKALKESLRQDQVRSKKEYPREFLITVDKGTGKEETMAVQPEWAIKQMALKLYEQKNGPRSTRGKTFESLNLTKDEIIEAFSSVLTSLRT